MIRSAPLSESIVAAPPPEPALAANRHLAVGVIGPGHVGSALLAQLRSQQSRLLEDRGLALSLCGVIGRQRMWLDCDDPDLNSRSDGAQTWRPADLDEFAAYVHGTDTPRHALLIDCSASDAVVAHYASWLRAGIHLVTPNKLAISGPLPRWQEIDRARRVRQRGRLRYEATVGAGLPVIQTLRSLLDTGDELLKVDGMFSGTLAWLCNRHDGSHPFSVLLREAQALGYTEPDPRDDLSGQDVARKLVILAREAGHPLSLEDVAVESLVPESLVELPLDTFMERLDELDVPMAAQLEAARRQQGVLRHVASFDPQHGARVRLDVLPSSHPFSHTRLTDNIVQFTTQRYCKNPLLVQGPGAGPEVTAAGVFADLLLIADTLAAQA